MRSEWAIEGSTDGWRGIGLDNQGGIAEMKQMILVVDDDMMNRRIAERILGNEFDVVCASSGSEALESIKEHIPDLILLDIHMPGMDGFEVMQRIHENETYKEVPIILLTADNDRETEVRGFKEGALDFIAKPFIAEVMQQRVSRILELNRLQKNLRQEVVIQTRMAEERRRKVELLSVEVMQALAGAIDAKDNYTNGHSVRVATYASEIAKRCGKSESEQKDIYYMGLLHDIGKIGIPDEIINKPASLTEEEYEVIKQHPVIGADILKNITQIPGIVIGARWHHERYDGAGYPDGLVGEEIPEVARIICVADSYDAMSSKRRYRDVLPKDVVRNEIKNGAGKQFDPVFAEKMLEIMDEENNL